MKKITVFFFLALLFFSNKFFAENYEVDFFGITSNDADSAMLSMAENMYAKNLGEMQTIVFHDKRAQKDVLANGFDFSLATSPFILFGEIKKLSDEKWKLALSFGNARTKKISESEYEYDSFYKILLESKNVLSLIFQTEKKLSHFAPSSNARVQSAEELAGTWKGEEFIDKIVILRGGKGFVIFQNGAAMNISISLQGSTIIVLQTSSPNASFFPDLPRQAALSLAVDAKPIEWKFSVVSNTKLSGTKQTLVSKSSGYARGFQNVEWTKQ